MSLNVRRFRSRLDSLVIAVVVASAIAIALFIHDSIKQIREALPAQVLEHQQDMFYMLNDLSDLVRASELARIDPDPEHTRRALASVNSAIQRLEGLRQTYSFEFLFGATAIHAAVYPALEDIKRWLRDGVYSYAPDSAAVGELVYLRASGSYRKVHDLFGSSNRMATRIVGAETEHLERFRYNAAWYLAAFALFALSVVVLLVRQRNAEARIVRLQKRLIDSIESLNEGFALYDEHDKLVICNQRFRDFFPTIARRLVPGTSYLEIVRMSLDEGLIEGIDQQSEHLAEACLAHYRAPGEPFEMRLRDGCHIRVSNRNTQEGGSVAIYTDITNLKQVQSQLEHLATHDALTELVSRRAFQDRLEHATAQSRRYKHQLAVMFIDLDRFKLVNDRFGHPAGDELLKKTAQSLRNCTRSSDTVARLGGDEFAVIVENVKSRVQVMTSAKRVMDALASTLEQGDLPINVTASIGIAMFPQDGDDLAMLIKNADTACYRAKALGRSNYQFYTADMDGDMVECRA